jgi:electron transport complex protein RnfC
LEKLLRPVLQCRISIKAIATNYPQGAQKMLAYSLLGIEIPSGSRSSEAGLAIFNVATLAKIGALFRRL